MGETKKTNYEWCLDDLEPDAYLGQVLSSYSEDEMSASSDCVCISKEELRELLPSSLNAVLLDVENSNHDYANSPIEPAKEILPGWIGEYSIADLHVSVPCQKACIENGIMLLDDFFGMTKEDILRLDGFEGPMLSEIEIRLHCLGLPALDALLNQESKNAFLGEEEEKHVGPRYVIDAEYPSVRIFSIDRLLGKPVNKCEYQENLLTFFGVLPKDEIVIRDFCENNRLSWFSAIWQHFNNAARLLYGPEEPLDILLNSSIDHLVTDLGAASFEAITLELVALFERKLELVLSINKVLDEVACSCPNELLLIRADYIARSIYPDAGVTGHTIVDGLADKKLSILELYSVKKAIVALLYEFAFYRQATSWQMLFSQSIVDCLKTFNPNAMNMYLPRLGISSTDRPPTLEEVGVSCGVTRERVRQVEKKISKQVSFESVRRLVPLRIALYSAVLESNGGDSSDRIKESLKRIGLEIDDLNVEKTAELFPELSYDSKNKLISLSLMPCSSCEKAQKVCARISEDGSYLIAEDFYRQAECASCAFPIKPDLRLFDGVNGLCSVDGCLGANANPVMLYKKRPSNIRACVRAIYYESKSALSVQEVADIASERTGKAVSKIAVNSHVSSIDECSLWGRGTYIDNRNMPYPEDLLQQVSNFCCTRFQSAKIPLVGAGGVYELFSVQLAEEGVPNEQALYSLLRKHADCRLELREYPWICDKEHIQDRTTFAKYFYSVVEANNGFITDDHAREIADRAMTQSWALDGLSQYSPFLIRANGGWFNIEAAGFDLDGVASLACEIAHKMRDNDIVSCKKVFENHKERCYSYGVKSYDILYRLIDMMEDDLPLTASRIPHLIKTDKPSMGVKEAVRLYIRSSTNPVTHSEIIEEFGMRRGINTAGLCSAILLGKDIIEVAQGTYWSMANLKMNDEFMTKFDEAVEALSNSAQRVAGLFYSKNQIIPSFECLPSIPGARWTDALLNAIFKRSKTFKSFGETGECIVNIKQNPDVKNVEAFYYALLSNEFYGWAAFDKFADYCASLQIRHGLEPEFFDAFDSIEASKVSIECR